jgi:hypothetical protein
MVWGVVRPQCSVAHEGDPARNLVAIDLGKLRDELPERESFDTLLEAKVLVERWRQGISKVSAKSSGAMPERVAPPLGLAATPGGSRPYRPRRRKEGGVKDQKT